MVKGLRELDALWTVRLMAVDCEEPLDIQLCVVRYRAGHQINTVEKCSQCNVKLRGPVRNQIASSAISEPQI